MTKITAKQLANDMDVSVRTAERYLKDIKQHFNIKIVLKPHMEKYFKIDSFSLHI